ncbi:MAG: class I SAM-dependent methyltransferase [Gammaproteobacteria bacterium]
MESTNQYKQIIQLAFDTVAPGYDHPSLAFFPETAAHIVQQLKLEDDLHLLDVCTGTGMVALTAAEQLPRGKVTGIDLSSGMLQQAQQKAAQRGLENTEFIQMDLDYLDLASNSFDVAISSFGLFFLQDMQSALSNIVATVKPGGRVAISSFTGNAFDPFSRIFLERYQSFGMEVPDLSWKRLATPDNISALFESVALGNIQYHHLPLAYAIEQPQQWWDVVWNAGYRGLLNQLSDEQQEQFKQQHFDEIRELLKAGKLWMETEVILAIGHKANEH